MLVNFNYRDKTYTVSQDSNNKYTISSSSHNKVLFWSGVVVGFLSVIYFIIDNYIYIKNVPDGTQVNLSRVFKIFTFFMELLFIAIPIGLIYFSFNRQVLEPKDLMILVFDSTFVEAMAQALNITVEQTQKNVLIPMDERFKKIFPS